MRTYLIILALTLVGIGSALYLSIPAYEYWNGADSAALQMMPCDISDRFSCSSILKNQRAIIFDIPVTKITRKYAGIEYNCPTGVYCKDYGKRWLPDTFKVAFPMIALVVYPILALLALTGYLTRKIIFAKIITVMAIGGICFNGYVISQEVIVGIFCPVCALCTIIITTIALLGASIWREGAKEKKERKQV